MVHAAPPPGCRCTPDNVRKICEAVRLGCSIRAAAHAIGVSSKQVRRWRDQGKLDDSIPEDSCYRDLYLGLLAAEAELEKELVEKWTTALKNTTDGWKGIEAFLQKRFREDWGKQPTEIQASVLDMRKTPEFKSLIKLLNQTLTPEQQVELSKMLDEMGGDDDEG